MSSHNQIMALTIPSVMIHHAKTPPSIPHIIFISYPSNTKWLNLGNVNHLSFQLSKSHRVPNFEDVAMCGFIVLPPRHPLASQALHHFRSTKSGISRETQVVQHTDHLIKLSKFKNVIASELRIIDRLSVNIYHILQLNAIDMFDFASNLIKVCCFEVTEDFRILFTLLISSHPTQGRKIMDKIA